MYLENLTEQRSKSQITIFSKMYSVCADQFCKIFE